MIIKNIIIAKCFKQSSNIDEENNQIIDINKRILQRCLKSSIIRHRMCTIGYKKRLKLLNDLEKEYILEKHNSRIKISLLVDQLVSNLEYKLFLEAVAAPKYALLCTYALYLCSLHCSTLCISYVYVYNTLHSTVFEVAMNYRMKRAALLQSTQASEEKREMHLIGRTSIRSEMRPKQKEDILSEN